MNTQRGFVSLTAVLVVLLGLTALGGGAYYVSHQKSASPAAYEDFSDTFVPSENPTATVTPAAQVTPAASVNTNARLVLVSPAPNSALRAGEETAIRWTIPQSVLDSFPKDFKLGLFLNVVQLDTGVNAYGINDGTNNPAAGSVTWKVPADAKPGAYRIDAYLSATPKDASRLCAVTLGKDCSPSAADVAIMTRASEYKSQSGSFTIAATQSQSGSISVPGMTKYTDRDFGFTFWYPSKWTISNSMTMMGDVICCTLKSKLLFTDQSGEVVMTVAAIDSEDRSVMLAGGACGTCAPIRYYFDINTHLWMKQYPDGIGGAPDMAPAQFEQTKEPQRADISANTMGGLHMFNGGFRFGSTLIPLSAHHFLYIYAPITGTGEYHIEAPLARTVVATDPSVATPVSIADQKKVIEAEASAY